MSSLVIIQEDITFHQDAILAGDTIFQRHASDQSHLKERQVILTLMPWELKEIMNLKGFC